MNDLARVFTYDTDPIRVIVKNGDPLFCVPDVCRGLEHSNPSMALKLVDEDDRVLIDTRETDIPNLNRTPINPKIWFVTEPGFYTLALASQAPGAKRFRRWITHEVLPAIRKTGSYSTALAIPTSFAEALQLAADQARQIEEQAAQLAIAAPKAESWDVLASGAGDYSVGDAAKILSRDPGISLGSGRLFGHLAAQGWIYRQPADNRWRAYQRHVDNGRLSELPQTYTNQATGETAIAPPQVRITVKGLHKLHRDLGGRQPLQLPLPIGA